VFWVVGFGVFLGDCKVDCKVRSAWAGNKIVVICDVLFLQTDVSTAVITENCGVS
jgi:hypothetical protein